MRNFIFIVIVVIYAVVYIVRLARKPRTPSRPAMVREDLFADEDDEDDVQDLPSARLPSRAEAYMPPPAEEYSVPPAEPVQADFAPIESFAAASPAAPPGKNAGPASSEGIFQQFEKMPPLARAVVLSEILGPPKGTAS
ncbi:MAG: hypothetical protein LBK08_10070 [Treponema sp.]|jgi:hypothetical protein|nr:hypothetical protein [Treponema sp.]